MLLGVRPAAEAAGAEAVPGTLPVRRAGRSAPPLLELHLVGASRQHGQGSALGVPPQTPDRNPPRVSSPEEEEQPLGILRAPFLLFTYSRGGGGGGALRARVPCCPPHRCDSCWGFRAFRIPRQEALDLAFTHV